MDDANSKLGKSPWRTDDHVPGTDAGLIIHSFKKTSGQLEALDMRRIF